MGFGGVRTVIDADIGIKENLLDVEVDRPRTRNRIVKTCLESVAKAVVIFDRIELARLGVIEEGVVDTCTNIRAPAAFRQLSSLY